MSTLPAAPPVAPASHPPPQHAEPQTPPPPAAIDGALPAGLDAILQVHETCAREPARPLRGARIPTPSREASPRRAGVWSQELVKAGATLTIPRDAQVNILLGVVVRGEATVRALESRDGAPPLAAWGALRAAGAGVVLTARQPDTRLVLAVVTDGKAVGELGAPVAWKAPKARPAPLETRDLAKSDDLVWAGGAMHARLGFEKGRASLGLLLASRDAGVARHRHDDAWEVLVALRTRAARSSSPRTPRGTWAAAWWQPSRAGPRTPGNPPAPSRSLRCSCTCRPARSSGSARAGEETLGQSSIRRHTKHMKHGTILVPMLRRSLSVLLPLLTAAGCANLVGLNSLEEVECVSNCGQAGAASGAAGGVLG